MRSANRTAKDTENRPVVTLLVRDSVGVGEGSGYGYHRATKVPEGAETSHVLPESLSILWILNESFSRCSHGKLSQGGLGSL